MVLNALDKAKRETKIVETDGMGGDLALDGRRNNLKSSPKLGGRGLPPSPWRGSWR